MYRPFLFLAGEFAVSMPLVFSTSNWEHTMSARLVYKDGKLRRHNRTDDDIRAVMHFADYDVHEIERENLSAIIESGVPCWPDVATLVRMLDRHDVMQECIDVGLVSHRVVVTGALSADDFREFDFPFVVKTGNEHRGINKHLCESLDDTRELLGRRATVEPFFSGRSVRAFVAGNDTFGVLVENGTSWIKNSPGASASPCDLPSDLVSHARAAASLFGLEVAGVDYVIENDNTFRFLEVNQYPGLSPTDEVAIHTKRLLKEKMVVVASQALR